MSFFFVRCLKCHFPHIKNVMTFFLFIKVPRWFTRKEGNKIKFFCFFVYNRMECPVIITRIISKFDRIDEILIKEFSEFSWYCWWLNLIWMNWWTDDLMGSVYRICDDNYTINVGDLNSLINATFNGKKLSFYSSEINHMV